MPQASRDRLKAEFLGWQCRIRQIALRDYGGQPLAAMRPRVSLRSGEVVLAAMTVLLVPAASAESTAFFRFQAQKTPDPNQVREAGIKYMAGGFYQEPELFSDEMTAVFGMGSAPVERLLAAGRVTLDFEQFSQSFRMFCKVRELAAADEARQASLWQARIFNPGIANDAQVLAFRPDWKTVAASMG